MMAALLAACSTAKKEETEQIINDVEIAEEEAEEVEKIVEKPRLHFSSAQQAMQYMDESEDMRRMPPEYYTSSPLTRSTTARGLSTTSLTTSSSWTRGR